MKKVKIPTILTVRTKTNQQTYYTWSHWPSKNIDGITFIPVNKFIPNNDSLREVHYIKKDNIEYVK